MQKEEIKNKKKNKGFVVLFSIILTSIILTIALGASNIALQEINFNTSAKNSNEAFFAADVGVECALYNDNLGNFPIDGPASPAEKIFCGGQEITPNFLPSFSGGDYDFVIPKLGNAEKNCAVVKIIKNDTTSIISKGYNMGDENCVSSSTKRMEREIEVSYATN